MVDGEKLIEMFKRVSRFKAKTIYEVDLTFFEPFMVKAKAESWQVDSFILQKLTDCQIKS
ncbi:MAG: hypothetical protein U0T81_08565 [Saprospiraceae bacterium]